MRHPDNEITRDIIETACRASQRTKGPVETSVTACNCFTAHREDRTTHFISITAPSTKLFACGSQTSESSIMTFFVCRNVLDILAAVFFSDTIAGFLSNLSVERCHGAVAKIGCQFVHTPSRSEISNASAGHCICVVNIWFTPVREVSRCCGQSMPVTTRCNMSVRKTVPGNARFAQFLV